MAGIFEQLKQRNVFRATAAYAVIAWLVLQVADLVLDNLDAPAWIMRAVMLALAIGLPIVVAFSWAFEFTAEGVKPEREVDHSAAAPGRGRRLDRLIIAGLVLAVAVLLVDRLFLGPRVGEQPAAIAATGPGSAATGGAAADERVSVAVLPFRALSEGEDDEYFADGLTEEILNSLAQLPELLVTGRTSSFYFKDRDVPVQEIAGTLGVEHIVEGSVRRSADRLRITVQLIRAREGFQLWSRSYDRDAGETFEVQKDIAEQIATALDVVLDDRRRAQMRRTGVRDPAAFIAFQKGLALFERAHGELPQVPTLARANVHFERALEIEPGFYEAYVRHSDYYSHILLSLAADEAEAADIPPAAAAAAPAALEADFEAAIRAAPDTARRLNAEFDRAFMVGDWYGLAGLVDRLLAPDDCATPAWHHLATAAFGRGRALLRDYERVVVCDPLVDQDRVHQLMALLWLGEFDEAIAYANRVGSTDEWIASTDVMAYLAAGRYAEADRLIAGSLRDERNALANRAALAALRGDAARAVALETESVERYGRGGVTPVVFPARRGDRDAANREAARIDARAMGHVLLLQAVYFCLCGAPFDLDATPNLKARIAASGLSWPPPSPIDWPLRGR